MFGFGIDVPYVKNMTQVIGQPVADNSGKCGDSYAVQQMLAELGYYAGQVDGQLGPQSLKAIRVFAESVGLSTGGTFPKADVCQAIISAYTAKMAATAPTASPSTTWRSRYTVSKVTRPRIIVLKKPDGTMEYVEADAGPFAKIGGWWGEQSTMTKVAVVGGGVAIVGGIAWLTMGRKKVVPNRRRRRHRR